MNRYEHDQRRAAIVEAARHVIFRKGYERMTIEDIRGRTGLSNGAFFHYFRSKPAVLEALVEQIRREGDAPLAAVLEDSQLPALAKLQKFFVTLEHVRATHQEVVVDLLRVWYTEDNVRVRQRVGDAVREHRRPLLAEVIRQGVRDGTFTTSYPEQAADITLTLIERMGAAHAQLLLAGLGSRDRQALVEEVLTVRAAFLEAIERVLGAPPDALPRGTSAAVEAWLDALHSVDHD